MGWKSLNVQFQLFLVPKNLDFFLLSTIAIVSMNKGRRKLDGALFNVLFSLFHTKLLSAAKKTIPTFIL